jgi:arginase family enzyme
MSDIKFCSINTDFDPNPNEGLIKNKFDVNIPSMIYKNPQCYELLYKQYDDFFKNNKCIVNISSDRTISASTISGLATNIIKRNNDGNYSSDLKIIYIDSTPDLNLFDPYEKNPTNKMHRTSVVSNLLCLINDSETETSITYTKHPLQLEPSQFIFLGLQNLTDMETNFMLENSIEYYELSKCKTKLESILDMILYECSRVENIAIIFDLTALNLNIAPCTIRDENNNVGFNLNDLNLILSKLSTLTDKIRLLDIVGHYFKNTVDISTRITIETIQQIYGKIFKLQESSLNIFNEHSKFLIYRPLAEENHGWYILRGIDLKLRDEILSSIEDNISLITIPNEHDEDDGDYDNKDGEGDVDVLITATSIAEQDEVSYYATVDINDCVLYPEEKSSMLFELLNFQKNI